MCKRAARTSTAWASRWHGPVGHGGLPSQTASVHRARSAAQARPFGPFSVPCRAGLKSMGPKTDRASPRPVEADRETERGKERPGRRGSSYALSRAVARPSARSRRSFGAGFVEVKAKSAPGQTCTTAGLLLHDTSSGKMKDDGGEDA